jgi:uncharacterized protein (TIGR02118 family)
MIKVSVLYPNETGKRFDIDYYCNKHMPIAVEKLGAACKGAIVEQGLAGGEPGSAPPYIVIASFLFDSIGDFQKAVTGWDEELAADLKNYTDIQPIMQINEIKLKLIQSLMFQE